MTQTFPSKIDSHRILWIAYQEARKQWLKSETTDFEEELENLFDELEDFFEVPMGN